MDLHKVERKWQRKWRTLKVFESDASDRPKFFVTFPFPYVNGFAHIGHSYSAARVDVFARYKRMKGFNVLFPQGWHATGSPIESAARKVRERDASQLDALRLMGFSDSDIPAFEDPLHWVKIFSKAWDEDLRAFGFSIDWRRNFITTDLNPRFSKFIKWQFRNLKRKGFVAKGSHPVVWSQKDGMPVGDHDRSSGEGETPQALCVIKFKGDFVFPCATFRPETVYGVTNVWVNPDLDYVEAVVDNESWVVANSCVEKLILQKHIIKPVRVLSGKELVGKKVINPVTGASVPVLAGSFVSEFGTGVVMSVPAHAPFDFVALRDVQKLGVAVELTPIKVISADVDVVEVVNRLKISSQADKEKLDLATDEVYKKEFHSGLMSVGEFSGKLAVDARELLKQKLLVSKQAVVLWELINPVISRSGASCVVKIVDDQWFMKYSLPEWKSLVMKCLEQTKLYPEKVRAQFEHVVGWLNDWACTREYGLGTPLPWDSKWKIESLSDSTIYMAFYTVAHLLKKIPLGKIDDKLFDYIFAGGDSSGIDIEPALLNSLRQEFEYWYPVDFRNSGKDLIQNHLVFFLFNHVALFSEKYWPKGIAVNGYVTIQKQKMSKSKGVFKTLRHAISEFSADVVRVAILSTGEELNDVDWDPQVAVGVRSRLEGWYDFARKFYSPGDKGEFTSIDAWMEHQLNCCISLANDAMDKSLFRSALMYGFFEIQRHLKWYLRRKNNRPNPELISKIIIAQTKFLAPFAPHLCEELWSKLGFDNLISFEKWPVVDESKINALVGASEDNLVRVLDDVKQVLKLAKVEVPKKITLFVASDWKVAVCHKLQDVLLSQTRSVGEVMKAVLPVAGSHASEASQLVQRAVKDPSKLRLYVVPQSAEVQFLVDSKDFLMGEFGCDVHIVKEQDSSEVKAKQSMPGKPAILVE